MKNSHHSNFILYTAVAVSAFTWAAPAFADVSQASDAQTELGEVVVTAQRVESDLQHTPVAVTAFSETALEQQNVTNIADLSGIAPGLQIGTRGGTGASSGDITIRGMGVSASPPGSAPAVGLYIDEVYYPALFGNLIGVFDVNSIDVLRGPQGTLFGRNTIGGALLYSSNQPKLGDLSGFAELNGGNQGRADVQGGVNLPLGDIAALRLTAGVKNEAGYVHDELNDINRGSEHDRQARLQLRVDPTDSLQLNFKMEDLEQRNNGQASIVTAFNGNTVFGAPFAAVGQRYISTGFYELAGYNGQDLFSARFRLVQATAAYKLNDSITLKSISAYSVSNSFLILDQDFTPLPIIEASRGLVRDSLITQEFRASGDSFGNTLHWSGGIYFYGEQSDVCCGASTVFTQVSDPHGNYVINTQSYSAYGQATYDITSQIAVVAGARYTDEELQVNDDAAPPALPFYAQKVSFNNTSPLMGLNYQANKDLLLYAKASQGFRAGGFSPTVVGSNEYKPETAKTYEVGARWELLDHRLRINPTLYQTLWDSIQFNNIGFCTCYPGPLPFVQNAGNAKVKGAELEIQAALTDRLSLTGSLSIIDSRYTSIAPFLVANKGLYSDTPFAYAPKTAFFLGPQYTLPLANSAKLIGSFSYNWQSAQRSATDNSDNVEIGSYGLLGGRLTYQAPDSRWSVAVWGRNLTDKRYSIGGTDWGNGGAIPVTSVDVGRPREYGATARYNF